MKMELNTMSVRMKLLMKNKFNRISFLFAVSILMFSCSSTNAQEKEVAIHVFKSDSTELYNAEIRVVTTTGIESTYSTNENGMIKLTLDCEVGYFITCDYKSHHKEKIKLMKPCTDLKKDVLEVYMKSNLISH